MNLSDAHKKMLFDESGISEQVAAARPYRTITDNGELQRLGFSNNQQLAPGLLIPICAPDGSNGLYQFRPNNPRDNGKGKIVKYETMAGAAMRLDCPPVCRPQLGDPSTVLWITEGSKKADALASRGKCAIALVGVWNFKGKNEFGGVTFLADWDYIHLKDREVVIVFDSDVMRKKEVEAALDRLKEHLKRKGAKVKLVYLPDAENGEKQGVDDFLVKNSLEDLESLVGQPKPKIEIETEEKPRRTQATVLMELAENLEFFHTPTGDCYAIVQIGDHFENLRLNTKAFRTWLSRQFYDSEKQTPSAQTLQDVINTLSGKALFDGECLETHVRVAEHGDAIFIDLCNDEWQAIKIDKNDWSIVESNAVPVKFRRTRGMLPLPIPESGGSLDDLRPFVNVADEDFILISAWIISTLRPNKPFPCLGMYGEQGSAKSTTQRVCRTVVDPNQSALRSRPRDERDLMIAANNSWIVSLDNLSGISADLSDALCRLATGGGFSTRELYSNDDEILFNSMRPILFNGIEELANRSDLLERSLILNLPRITEAKRKTEAEFWRDFEAAKPKIIGALFDTVSKALKTLPTVKLANKPRMADFAEFAFAAFGDDFLERYEKSRESANETALEASPLALAIQLFMSSHKQWNGTATELMQEFEKPQYLTFTNQEGFPKQANVLSGKLKRIAPNLRSVGIFYEVNERAGGTGKKSFKLERLEKAANESSQSSQSSQTNKNGHKNVTMNDPESSQTSSQTVTNEGCDDVSRKCDDNEKTSSQFSTNKNGHCDDVTICDDVFQTCSNKDVNTDFYNCEGCDVIISIREDICPECNHDNTPPF